MITATTPTTKSAKGIETYPLSFSHAYFTYCIIEKLLKEETIMVTVISICLSLLAIKGAISVIEKNGPKIVEGLKKLFK